MVLVHKTYSGIRGALRTLGSAFLVVAGFFLVFFTSSAPNFGGVDRLGGQTVAHADAPLSCTTCGKGGDTGGGDGEHGDTGCGCAGAAGCMGGSCQCGGMGTCGGNCFGCGTGSGGW